MTLALLAGLVLAAELPVDAPVVPAARQLEEPGRYQSSRSYEETLKFYERAFRSGGVRWYSIVNLPGIKAKHIASLRKRTSWEGINVYETRGEVRFYIIPREKPGGETATQK